MSALQMTGTILREITGDTFARNLATSASDKYELVPVEVVDGIADILSQLQDAPGPRGELNLRSNTKEFVAVVELVARYAREVGR